MVGGVTLLVGLVVWAAVAASIGKEFWWLNLLLLAAVIVGSFRLQRRVIVDQRQDALAMLGGGFKARYEVKAGRGMLYFDPERRELAVFEDAKLLHRVGYDDVEKWQYLQDPGGVMTYAVATRDPARPFIKWYGRLRDGIAEGEAFLAAAHAAMGSSPHHN